MFTTFVGTPQSLTGSNKDGSDARASSFVPEQPTPIKRKRHQVARACDWCRIHRVKCDNNVPCENCHSRGRTCSNKGSGEFRTLTNAHREIERLRQKIAELELQASREAPRFQQQQKKQQSGNPKRLEEGVHISTAYSQHRTWYGPSSLFYFISRMNAYLTATLQQPHLEKHILPNSVAKSFGSPDCSSLEDSRDPPSPEDKIATQSGHFMTATQEEYFLNLFWQSYHSSLLVLNEIEFKQHFRSLWAVPGKPRKPSALVDIVIAMSMQYGMATLPRNCPGNPSGTEVDADDPTIAGRWYYRRCQALLSSDLESPTLSTVQCQVLSVIYLCCASFQNMAHSTLAVAVRTANMLGLHMEPPAEMPTAERELRKRLWWSLYTVESKTCMKLGRPFSTDLSSVSCSLPADDHEAASSSGSDFAPLAENVTWLTFNLQNTKLVLAARTVHTALFDQYSEIFPGESGGVIYDDAAAFQRCADFLSSRIESLQTWAQHVPDALKTSRKGNGVVFSTDLSPLAVEQFAPLWVQRQRLLLELLYHNVSMNLCRPFIAFSAAPVSPTSVESSIISHARSAAEHAMALSHIMHQILTETDILAGFHEAFQWQWNGAITLVGYLLAHPTSDLSTPVRQAIDRALTVFEVFGRSFAAAASAAGVVHNLTAKADLIRDRAHLGDAQVHSATITAANSVPSAESHRTVTLDSGDFSDADNQGFHTTSMLNLLDEANLAAMNEVLVSRPLDMSFFGDGFNAGFELQFPPFMCI